MQELVIKIADIEVRDRLRDVDASKVEALKTSFAELGMRTPITVRLTADDALPYSLSAGAHRLEAARQLGWNEIPAYVRDESKLDAELWEIDENLARSELSPADRAVFTFRRKELYLLKYPETAHGGDRKSSRKNCDLIDRHERKSFVATTAELTGKSERTIQLDAERGEKVCEAAIRLLRGTRFNTAKMLDVLKKKPSDVAQIAYVEGLLAEDRNVTAKSKEVRAHTQKVKHATRMTIAAEIAKRGRETAPGKIQKLYPIIYADPPWKFETHSEITGGEKGAENHYPTMEFDAICRLFNEIGDPATPDAMLYLWVTTPMKGRAINELLPAWGFEYVSEQIWNKVDIGTGYQVRDQHESVLFAKRGRGFAPLLGEAPPSLYTKKKGRHSEKPSWFAEQLERIYPDLPKLEMFCRDPRPGWDAWGYEAAGRAAE